MRRAVGLLTVVILVVAAAVAGWKAAPRDTEGVDLEEPAPLTVLVERGTVSEVVFASGSTTYAELATLRANRGVVTAVAEPGATVEEGESPVEIDLRPMILLVGERPMFRDLGLQATGEDVLQFQLALARLGYDVGEPDGTFGSRTVSAWRMLQEDLGMAKLDHVLASDVGFVPVLPARVGQVSVVIGEPVGGPLLSLTSLVAELVADLPSNSADSVVEGTPAELVWAGSDTVEAKVGRVEDDGEGVVAVLSVEPSILVPATFRVRLLLAAGSNEGLVVPLSAVSTDTDGSTYVNVWDPDERQQLQVEVVIVASSRTHVQVEGALAEGDEVVIGS